MMFPVDEKVLSYQAENISKVAEDASCFAAGEVCFENGAYVQAVEHFNKAIALNDRVPRYFYQKGMALYRLEEYKDALNAFEKASDLDAQDTLDVFVWMGKICFSMEDPGSALTYFNKSIDLNPSATVFLYRAMIYNDQKKFDLAFSDYVSGLNCAEEDEKEFRKDVCGLLGKIVKSTSESHREDRLIALSKDAKQKKRSLKTLVYVLDIFDQQKITLSQKTVAGIAGHCRQELAEAMVKFYGQCHIKVGDKLNKVIQSPTWKPIFAKHSKKTIIGRGDTTTMRYLAGQIEYYKDHNNTFLFKRPPFERSGVPKNIQYGDSQ